MGRVDGARVADPSGGVGWRRGKGSCYQAKERHSRWECGRGERMKEAPGLVVQEGIMAHEDEKENQGHMNL